MTGGIDHSPEAADAFLGLLSAEPTLLDLTYQPVTGEHVTRRSEEGHRCLPCGQLAMIALILTPKISVDQRPRWLDLCPECARWVTAAC